jgi:hypothetical protein
VGEGASVVIEFAGLWTCAGRDDRAPLSRLRDEPGHHVHGELQVVVGGRRLPGLGFFGPDDVCFDEWVHELRVARERLAADSSAVHVYDDEGQGQPAFELRRVEDTVLVSVVAGSGGGRADPGWQEVPCSLRDFVAAVDAFVEDLTAELNREAGDAGQRWMDDITRAL